MKIRKDGKVIRLTESDLRIITEKYLNEEKNSDMDLELLNCLSKSLDIGIMDIGKFKNCVSCATKISNGEIPSEDEIMECMGELRTKINEDCDGDILQKGICASKKMVLAAECFAKFGMDNLDGGSIPKLPGYGGGMF
jgi:hypothetical protein